MYEHSRFITPRLIWFTALHIVLFFAMILFYHSVLCCSTQSVYAPQAEIALFLTMQGASINERPPQSEIHV